MLPAAVPPIELVTNRFDVGIVTRLNPKPALVIARVTAPPVALVEMLNVALPPATGDLATRISALLYPVPLFV